VARHSNILAPGFDRGSYGVDRSSTRLMDEPVRNCKVPEFRRYMKEVILAAKYNDPAKIPTSFDLLISALDTARYHPSLTSLPVETVAIRRPHRGFTGPYEFFVFEVKFIQGRKPAGQPISGTYQGTIEDFLSLLE
jgi:hypothetical protein